MNAAGGYVRLYRRLLQHPIWTQLAPAVLKVAVYFLLRANYKPSQWYDGANSVDIPAGSFITSYAHTAEDCSISIQQARDAFGHLFGTQFATYRRTHRWTLVTVLNWASYQVAPDDAEHTGEHRVDQLRNRQGTTNEEVKTIRLNTPLPPEGDESGNSPLLISPEPNEKPASESECKRWFEERFWPIVWAKIGVDAARKAWARKVPDEATCALVVEAAKRQGPTILERGRRPGSSVLHPATWLNQGRYLDEEPSRDAGAQSETRLMA